MRKTIISGIFILIMTVSFTTCDGMTGIVADLPPSSSGELPPFVITRPMFEIIERPYFFKFAGLVFNFLNTGPKTVEKVTVSFLLFDPKTRDNPFIGSNKFEIAKWDIVFPGESREIIISLDQFIYIAPKEIYIIDHFFICEIYYTDGSVWQDKYGKFGVRGAV